MKHIICGLLLVSFLSSCLGYPRMHQEWADWKSTHSKLYNSVKEESARLEVWQENYKKIMGHNMANKTFTVSLNEFADMVRRKKFSFHE